MTELVRVEIPNGRVYLKRETVLFEIGTDEFRGSGSVRNGQVRVKRTGSTTELPHWTANVPAEPKVTEYVLGYLRQHGVEV